MTAFFDLFPKISYDIADTNTFSLVTDIFFRIGFLERIKNLGVAYYRYTLSEGQSPEDVADLVYSDVEGHWIIMMLNDVIDPNIDWYMSSRTFDSYIKNKYGSIAAATQRIHHYEKTTSYATDADDGGFNFCNTTSYIDYTDPRPSGSSGADHPDIPYDTYVGLPATSYDTTVLGNNETVYITVTTQAISCYDYEDALNIQRASIKLIYPGAYSAVKQEFQDLISQYNPARRLNLRSAKII